MLVNDATRVKKRQMVAGRSTATVTDQRDNGVLDLLGWLVHIVADL